MNKRSARAIRQVIEVVQDVGYFKACNWPVRDLVAIHERWMTRRQRKMFREVLRRMRK